VRVLEGDPLLVAAAVEAVQQWAWEPAPTEIITDVDVNFALSPQQG
jgi:outer membrane biosynthesis protein TonB